MKNRIIGIYIVICFVLFVIKACTPKATPHHHDHSVSSHSHSLEMKELLGVWSLVEMDGANVAKHKATLEIEKSSMKAFTGCNSFHDIQYKVGSGDNNISTDMSRVQNTMVACQQGSIETEYIKNLKEVYNVKAPQGVLVLSSNTGLEMTFIRARTRK